MRIAKDDVDVKMAIPGAVIRQRTEFGDVSGFGTISGEYFTLAAGVDTTPLFVGLKGNHCHCPHWGFVLRGQITTTDATTQGFRDAGLINAKIGGFYNFIAFVTAFAMIPVVRRIGAKYTHAVCLTLAGLAMLSIPSIHSQSMLFIPMIGVGLAWASIMGNPYSMLAHAIPKERVGIYMGIFNMFIVIPMFIQIMTLPLYYKTWLHGNPENVIRLAGALLLIAALAGALVSNKHKKVTI